MEPLELLLLLLVVVVSIRPLCLDSRCCIASRDLDNYKHVRKRIEGRLWSQW
jgi:hypothetical protein